MFHPHHGHGTVTGREGKHAVVKFDTTGSKHSFEVTPGGKPATLQPRSVTPQEVATDLATAGADDIGRLLGGGLSDFNGHVSIFPEQGNEAVLARMGWDGTMHVREDVAAHLAQAQGSTGTIHDPDAFAVILHELIHSVTSGGAGYGNQEDVRAYQRKTSMIIEEGFTELGATRHAPDFFDAVGVGDRPTPVLAVKDGHATEDAEGNLLHATMREWAERLADPKRVANGEAWGHYPQYTAAAQRWCQQVASLENRATDRAGELADEVNRAGVAGKVKVLAQQLLRAAGVADRETDAGRLLEIAEMVIYANWGASKSVRGKAFTEALKAIRPWMKAKTRL